jgi:fatty acid desaturase
MSGSGPKVRDRNRATHRIGDSNMTKNMGKQDRNLRLIAAGLFIVAAWLTGAWWMSIVGLILLATAAMGTCPAYMPFKIDTRKPEER